MTGLQKLGRFSLGVGPGVFVLGLAAGRPWDDALGAAFSIVAAGWVLWGALALSDEYQRVAVFAAQTTAAAIMVVVRQPADADEAEAPPLPPAPPVAPPSRMIRHNSRAGSRLISLDPEDVYQRQVRSFVILGERVGGFTYRDMRGRCLSTGDRVKFPLWRRITDDLAAVRLFRKEKHGGARPALPLPVVLARLASVHLPSVPLAGELVE